MYRINKYKDDLLMGIELSGGSGFFNIENFEKLYIKMYVLDSRNYVEAYYHKNPVETFHNIIKKGDQYFIRIEQDQLKDLENGQLRCFIEYSVYCPDFSDGTYDASDCLATDVVITNGFECINVINEKGCC